ncbi:MAG: hypothetical protein ACMXYG_07165 [Candidatus Woesearchaeota archaeon]
MINIKREKLLSYKKKNGKKVKINDTRKLIFERKLPNFSLFKSVKAMSGNEIFVYLLSLMIVAFIVIYGYMVISDFISGSSDVELLQFQKAIESYVESYSTEFGSVRFINLNAPGRIVNICFTDYYNINNPLQNCDGSVIDTNIHPIISDSYKTMPRERKNLFLLNSKGEVVNSYFIGNVSVANATLDCNYLCVRSFRGRFPLRIEGRGLGVTITDASSQ